MNDYSVIESDHNHYENFINGLESIIRQYRDSGKIVNSGFESYTTSVLKVNGLHYSPMGGFENFITDGVKKAYEIVLNLLKGIWNFFFGTTRFAAETKSNIKIGEDQFLKLEKTDNPKLNKLREVYYPLAKDFTNVEGIIKDTNEFVEAYEKVFGSLPPNHSHYKSFISLLEKTSTEMNKNITGEQSDKIIKVLTVTYFKQADSICDSYELIMKDVKGVIEQSNLKTMVDNCKPEDKPDVTKLISKAQKLLKSVGDKFTKLGKAFEKAKAVEEEK